MVSYMWLSCLLAYQPHVTNHNYTLSSPVYTLNTDSESALQPQHEKIRVKKQAKPFLSSRVLEPERNMTTRDSKKLWFLFSCAGCSYGSLPSAYTQNCCFSSDKTKQKKRNHFYQIMDHYIIKSTWLLCYVPYVPRGCSKK